MVAIKD